MKGLSNFIDHLECPSVNGIIFSNGIIQLFDIKVDYSAPAKYEITMGLKTSIDQVQKKENFAWNSFAILVSLKQKENNIEVIAGECDYGSEGFLAVLHLLTRKLIWVALFDNSNPFNEVRIEGEDIYATSTYKCIWKFNLKNPILFSVNCP